MAKTIRNLLVKVGVNTDAKRLVELNRTLGNTKAIAKGVGIALVATGAAITGATIHFAKAGAEAEKSQVAFETMTGSLEKANEIMKQMEEFSLETPFSFPEVEKNVKLLKAMGIEGDNLFTTIRSLGDVAAGLNVPLERIALNFGQVKAQGKLTGRELRDFAIAGVPIREMLAKNIGVPLEQIGDMISKGKVGFKDVRKAFESMAGPGGQFNNLMEKMSKTMGGVVSNIGVMWSLLSRDIGKEINKDLAPVISELFEFLKENRAVIAKRISRALRGIIGSLKTIGSFLYKFRKAFAFAGALLGLAALGKAIAMLGAALILATNTVTILGTTVAITGNKGLIAWLKMIAPLLLIGALAAALILIIEDVWTAMSRPEDDSGLKFLLKELELWEKFRDAIESVKKAYIDFKNIFFGEDKSKDPMSRGLGMKPKKGVFGEMWEDVKGIFTLKDFGERTAQYKPGFGATAPAGYENITAPITVNVNGSNATPGQIGAATRNGVEEAIKSANNNTPQRVK